jgi:hypothetical protein
MEGFASESRSRPKPAVSGTRSVLLKNPLPHPCWPPPKRRGAPQRAKPALRKINGRRSMLRPATARANGDAVTGSNFPYRGGVLIPRPSGQGWQVDLEIDGELIPRIYWNSKEGTKEQAVQEATRIANVIIASRERSASQNGG